MDNATATAYEIWIKNDPALDGKDCQCQIMTRPTMEVRGGYRTTLQTADRALAERCLTVYRKHNPHIADHYEVREVPHV